MSAPDYTPSLPNYPLHLTGRPQMTLEAPLHHFTYRLRALQGELGGAGEQAVAADQLWSAKQE